MNSEEVDKFIADEKQRLAQEEKSLKRKERNESLVGVGVLLLVGFIICLVLFTILKFLVPYLEQKEIEDQIAIDEEIAKNASDEAARLETERLAALEAKRLAELAAKQRRDDLKIFCTKYFDKGMVGVYSDYTFDDKDKAKAWLENVTKIRLDKTKTFSERVNYQLRFAFTHSKIQSAASNPIAIAVGDIDSTNFNASAGMVCVYEGLVTILGDGKDNLIYQITMRREWV